MEEMAEVQRERYVGSMAGWLPKPCRSAHSLAVHVYAMLRIAQGLHPSPQRARLLLHRVLR